MTNVCRALLPALLSIALGSAANATFMHGPYTGPNVDFTVIDETTQSGFGTADPEPLMGPMSTLGDSLLWSPTAFHATASGMFDFDEDKSNLEVQMIALSLGALDEITLIESGFVDLSGGTISTNATLTMSGTLVVTAGGMDYGFTFNESGTGDVTAVFTTPTLFTADVHPGVNNFSGTAFFDVVALLQSKYGVSDTATAAVLVWNDSLIVASEAGTTADAHKTSVEVVVPEPGTALLLAGGLMALGIRARGCRV